MTQCGDMSRNLGLDPVMQIERQEGTLLYQGVEEFRKLGLGTSVKGECRGIQIRQESGMNSKNKNWLGKETEGRIDLQYID